MRSATRTRPAEPRQLSWAFSSAAGDPRGGRLFRMVFLRVPNPATMEGDREAGLAEERAGFWRRNRWLKWVGCGLLAAVAVVAVVVAVVLLLQVLDLLRAPQDRAPQCMVSYPSAEYTV